MKVALATTPYYECSSTSFELGTLKSCLREVNISADHFNWHFEFAAKIGFEAYYQLSRDPHLFEAYWTFARNVVISNDFDFFKLSSITPAKLSEIRIEAERFQERLTSINWHDYSLLILDTFNNQLVPSISIARSIKKENPDLVVALSGTNVAHPIMGPEYLKLPWIDIVFLGELESAAVSLAIELQHKDLQEICLESIEGIAYRHDGQIVVQPDSHKTSMNNVPAPNYEDYLAAIHEHNTSEFFSCGSEEQFYLGMEFSRGCTYGNKKLCKFCSYVEEAGFSSSEKSVEGAIQLLKDLHENNPEITKFMLYDPLCPRKLLLQTLTEWSKIRHEYQDSIIFFQTKPWHLREDLEIMGESGAKGLYLGIESLRPEVLREFEKGQTVCQSLANLRWCKELGLYAEWWYLLGIPGFVEDHSSVLKLIPLIYHLPCPYYIKFINIVRGSPYFNDRYNLGIRDVYPYPSYRYVLPECIDLEKAAYYWSHAEWCDESQHSELISEISVWQEEFRNGASLILQGNQIHDRRDRVKTSDLSDDMLALLRFCDAPKSRRHLDKFSESSIAWALREGWIVELEGQVVSLVETHHNSAYADYLNNCREKHMALNAELGDIPNSRWR